MGNKNTSTLKPNDSVTFTLNFEYYTDYIAKNKTKLSTAELEKYFHSASFIRTLNGYIENDVLVHFLSKEPKGMNIQLQITKSAIKKVEIARDKKKITVAIEARLSPNRSSRGKITLHKLFKIYDSTIAHYMSSGGLIEQDDKLHGRGDVLWRGFSDVQLMD
jgi:hypothetical protein